METKAPAVTIAGLDPANPAKPAMLATQALAPAAPGADASAAANAVVRAAAAPEDTVVIDAKQRTLVVRRLNPVETYRMLKLTKATGEEGFFGMACMVASVRRIDDEQCLIPHSELVLEAMLQRLGEDGLAAVTMALRPAEAAEGLTAPKS